MHISQKGLNLIKEFEGCILQSYDDWNEKIINKGDTVRGTLTIGYGHIEDVYPGQTITQAQAEQMLREDMIRYENQVKQVMNEGIMNFEVGQNQFDALVSFCYNLGQGCVKTLCRNRDKQTVADMMLEYRNKGSQWEAGLLRRRKAERELFLSENTTTSNDWLAEYLKSWDWSEWVGKLQKTVGVNVDKIVGPITLKACTLLKKGCTGELVKRLQEILKGYGFNCGNIDGIFGDKTYNAVVAFQKSRNLTPDGIVGINTWRDILGI